MNNQEPTSFALETPKLLLDDIKKISVLFFNFQQQECQGEIYVHKLIEEDIRDLFAFIYTTMFPLSSVQPIEEYDYSDDLSMENNNTYAFAFRTVTNKPHEISNHGFGLALDINPKMNPYVKDGKMIPPTATYDPLVPGTLTAEHPLVHLLKERGFVWGGDWGKSYDDFQHFHKTLPDEYQAKYKEVVESALKKKP